jgi:hypothetical protein
MLSVGDKVLVKCEYVPDVKVTPETAVRLFGHAIRQVSDGFMVNCPMLGGYYLRGEIVGSCIPWGFSESCYDLRIQTGDDAWLVAIETVDVVEKYCVLAKTERGMTKPYEVGEKFNVLCEVKEVADKVARVSLIRGKYEVAVDSRSVSRLGSSYYLRGEYLKRYDCGDSGVRVLLGGDSSMDLRLKPDEMYYVVRRCNTEPLPPIYVVFNEERSYVTAGLNKLSWTAGVEKYVPAKDYVPITFVGNLLHIVEERGLPAAANRLRAELDKEIACNSQKA